MNNGNCCETKDWCTHLLQLFWFQSTETMWKMSSWWRRFLRVDLLSQSEFNIMTHFIVAIYVYVYIYTIYQSYEGTWMICFSTTEEKLSSNGGKMLKSCVLFKEKNQYFSSGVWPTTWSQCLIGWMKGMKNWASFDQTLTKTCSAFLYTLYCKELPHFTLVPNSSFVHSNAACFVT